MGLFRNQFSNVVEWEEYRDDCIFWKWTNKEIKKGSRLIIRPGQDAIFLYNGNIEGIFKEEGEFDIDSQIIPFLSTLKGFKFGFNSGMRAEVLFVISGINNFSPDYFFNGQICHFVSFLMVSQKGHPPCVSSAQRMEITMIYSLFS